MRKSIALAFVLAAACGGSSNNAPIPDAGSACTASASYGDVTSLGGPMYYSYGSNDVESGTPNEGFLGNINVDPKPDQLEIDLFAGRGAFGSGALQPGTYTLAGSDLSIAACGLCVQIYTDYDSVSMGNDGFYFATGGTVTITSVGSATGSDGSYAGTLAGSATNLTFVHADPDTGSAVDACAASIASVGFSGTLVDQSAGD